ncbi:hypothetical protein WG899_14595 [Paucibacter sp. AS339]|uniref:hypothetical protein n=1 Tax=Paucibacter hankyongi TaxID=3133434 RepID=UPI0030A38003
MNKVFHLLPNPQLSAPIFFDLRDHNGPDYLLGGVALDPALRPQAAVEFGSPLVGPVDPLELQRFQQLMQQEGQVLQPTRMMYDRLYACERLAQGHASANPLLRDLSLKLFNSYQQAGEWIGLAH